MKMRFDAVLVVLVVASALGVISAQHQARKFFHSLENEEEHSRQLAVEYGQLQIELSTWATSPRIEKIARETLDMRTPELTRVLSATSGSAQ